MAQIRYPIVCNDDHALEIIEPTIFGWLEKGVAVHFMYSDHSCSSSNFNLVSEGRHPTVKIIFIPPELELDVNALVAVFNHHYPPEDDETPMGDRRCPLCRQL